MYNPIWGTGGGPRKYLTAWNGEHSVLVNSETSEVFVVVVSVPDHFTGNQSYGYTLSAMFQSGAVAVIFEDGFESGAVSNWSCLAP